MLTLLITLMLLQSDGLTSPNAASGMNSSAADRGMGHSGAMSGYGAQISGYNTKAHPPESKPPSAGLVGGGGQIDKPLVLEPIAKPVIKHMVDRDNGQWDFIPTYAMYHNAKTGEFRYSPPAGSQPVKVKPKN